MLFFFFLLPCRPFFFSFEWSFVPSLFRRSVVGPLWSKLLVSCEQTPMEVRVLRVPTWWSSCPMCINRRRKRRGAPVGPRTNGRTKKHGCWCWRRIDSFLVTKFCSRKNKSFFARFGVAGWSWSKALIPTPLNSKTTVQNGALIAIGRPNRSQSTLMASIATSNED